MVLKGGVPWPVRSSMMLGGVSGLGRESVGVRKTAKRTRKGIVIYIVDGLLVE